MFILKGATRLQQIGDLLREHLEHSARFRGGRQTQARCEVSCQVGGGPGETAQVSFGRDQVLKFAFIFSK